MKFFKYFKGQPRNASVPDLIRKIDKNEITSYKQSYIIENKIKDRLIMKINIEKIDYIKLWYEELPFFQKYIFKPLDKFISKYFSFLSLRFEKIIYRPNYSLRIPYFGLYTKIYKNSNLSKFLFVILFSYLLGYTWAKLKYDTILRRYMYYYCFSTMMIFEYIDFHVGSLLEVIDKYIPLDMSGDQFEYIIYKKTRGYYVKKKLEKRFDGIVKTDKEIIEFDNLIKNINK